MHSIVGFHLDFKLLLVAICVGVGGWEGFYFLSFPPKQKLKQCCLETFFLCCLKSSIVNLDVQCYAK